MEANCCFLICLESEYIFFLASCEQAVTAEVTLESIVAWMEHLL